MKNNVEILTPVGRLVQGDVFEPQTKDMEGNLLTIKTGANAGKPRVVYFIAIAIPKTDLEIAKVLQKIIETARAAFPALFNANGACLNNNFAFKFTDGDLTPEKEGFANCWILKFSGGFAPKCFTRGGESIIVDKDAIKRGYYIRVYGTIAGNGSNVRPGIFLNPAAIELVGYGDEINTGVNGKTVFGNIPAALPPDVSATPLAPSIPVELPQNSDAPPVAPNYNFLNPQT